MKISPPLQVLQKHRRTLTSTIERLILTQNSLESRRAGAAACYDNRHPEAYYLKLKNRCETLRMKNKLTACERQEVINAALGYSYHPHLYLIFSSKDLKNFSVRQPAPAEYWETIVQSIKRGTYYQIIAPAPRRAEKYFRQALRRTHPAHTKGKQLTSNLLPPAYDYLSMALEARRLFPQAEECLTRALELGINGGNAEHMTKYQYIKRAQLRVRAGALCAALGDLTAAAAWRTDYFRAVTVFDLEEVIYWEKAKIFMLLKDYGAAQKMLTQLLNICELNYHPPDNAAVPRLFLLQTIKNHHAALRGEKKAGPGKNLPADTMAAAQPELPTNYDTFQVNTDCPDYQNFIAKIHAQDTKSFKDWEYIVAYRLSRLGDKRPYEKLLAPFARKPALDGTEWLVAALQNFYHKRDYPGTIRVLKRHLPQTPDCVGFELAAKAHLAQGDYKSALKYLSRGQALVKKLLAQGAAEKSYRGQIKMYHLLQGIAAAKINKLDRARGELAAALKLDAGWEDSYRRNDDLAYWELARLELRAENIPAAIRNLKKIYNRRVIDGVWEGLNEE